MVTRGAIDTPEQYIPGVPLEGAWEACITMGTSWQYQPRNETYKSGDELIRLIYETRAKGGNLLLNVGPKPDGELPIEQEERLRELALWMFVNQESVYAVRPWIITNEQNIWFTKKKDENTLYAVVAEPWKRGEWKDIVLHSVKSTAKTEVASWARTTWSTSTARSCRRPPGSRKPTACTSAPCSPSGCRTTASGRTRWS